MYKIGLTGGIATGKSTVSGWMAQRGVAVIDADRVAREVVEPGTPGLQAVADAFGKDVLLEDGQLNRPALGAIVFNNEAKRKQLNAILHSYIKERIDQLEIMFENRGEPAVIYDVPLLIEAGWYKDMDEVWLVVTDEATQIRRLMERNGLDEAEAACRIKSQLPLSEKRKYSKVIISNEGPMEELEAELEQLWERYKNRFEKELA
ncbi:MAG: dephospho-CoA kinase [Veillonella sp.]|uniref:dephospho-CoA kinase n=1 Tax=Veillonella sp. TaxID=1926307 RepID=UPI0025D711B9|nr:dephospho-CoA kinase [Veillonella sp.]MBS4912636.1 dephospho-CoA kinase [Veillonella sp.]